MKNTVFAFIAFLFGSASLFAQESESTSRFAYSNITEFGIFTTSPRSFALEGTTVQGISIDKQHHLGLGIGIGLSLCHSYEYSTAHMPMFVNYRYYFNSNKRRSPHFNASLGGVAVEGGGGFYSALTAGFKVGKFSFSSGLSFMAISRKEMRWEWIEYFDPFYERYDGYSVERPISGWHFPFGIVIKCGFTF